MSGETWEGQPDLTIGARSLSTAIANRMRTMTADPARALTIDVVSDVVCPWCYIGKRRLEAALATLAAREPGRTPLVRWHPFQLNPDLPPDGIDRRTYLETKFGGPARAAQIYERVRAAGRTRRHSVRVRGDRAAAEHARRAPADRVGAVDGDAGRRGRAGRAAVPRVLPRRAVRRRSGRARADRFRKRSRRGRRASAARLGSLRARGARIQRARAVGRHRRRAVLHLRRQGRGGRRAGARTSCSTPSRRRTGPRPDSLAPAARAARSRRGPRRRSRSRRCSARTG